MTSKNSARLTIVQMNDSHAYFDLHQEMFWEGGQAVYRQAGGYARIATIVKQIRTESPECIFCDCGDTLHGTYPAFATQGHAMIPILNSLGIDATTAHWEFAYGPEILKQQVARLNYPMLACNVFDKATRKPVFQQYIITEAGGLRIGITGVASVIVDKTMPPSFSEGIYFSLGNKELPSVIDILRNKEKVDLVVLVSHLGFNQDIKLVSEVQGIDVCLSAHTHNRLYKPVLSGKTIIIQSGCHGTFLGRLELEVAGGQIKNYSHRLMEVEVTIQPDPIIDELVRKALASYPELSEVVGETATALNRGTSLESTMDNFLLQALIESTGPNWPFPMAGVTAHPSFRAQLP